METTSQIADEFFLFTDTETTGFAKKGPHIQEGQARIVQLAMLLTDSNGKTLAEFSGLIKPDGWVSSEGALKVHQKSHEMCERHGFNIKSVMNLFSGFAARATHIVAHNEEFDHRMIDIEYAHASGIDAAQAYNATWVCTMKDRMVTQHFGGRWPKLADALKHFTGRVLGADAHDAMHDVKACRDIFFAARALQQAAA